MASAQAQLEVRYMILSSSGSFLYLSFFLPLATYKVLCAQQLIALVSVASLGFLILTSTQSLSCLFGIIIKITLSHRSPHP